MYPAGQHPIYSYTIKDKQFIIKESGLSESQIEEDIQTVMEWFEKVPHLSEGGIHKEMIEVMLIAAKGSVEKVKKRIENVYTYRAMSPELIQERIMKLNDLAEDLWEAYAIASMPKLYEGKRITVSKVAYPEGKSITSTNILITLLMIGDIRMVNDFVLGDIWILDLKDLTLGTVMKMNWFAMNKTFKIAKEGLGLRIFDIHIINCNIASVAQFIFNMLKHILSQKVLSRVRFHNSLEELYKYVPLDYLPKDYGGDMISTIEIKEKCDKLLRSPHTKKYLIEACKMVSDESKRNTDVNSEDLVGTFKKLDFD